MFVYNHFSNIIYLFIYCGRYYKQKNKEERNEFKTDDDLDSNSPMVCPAYILQKSEPRWRNVEMADD